MADKRNRTPFYGAVPTSSLHADHIFMADGSTLQEQADKKFELIEEITLEEATVLIDRTTEPDGTPYNFTKVFIEYYSPADDTSTDRGVYFGKPGDLAQISGQFVTTTPRYGSIIADCEEGILKPVLYCGTYEMLRTQLFTGTYKITDSITEIRFSQNPLYDFPIGMNIKIYAIRA